MSGGAVEAMLAPLRNPATVSEAEWARIVEAMLDGYGWLWTRIHAIRGHQGKWLTGTTSKGYPDYTALRPPWVLWLELKRVGENPTPEQRVWISRAQRCGGNVLAFVVDPSDGQIVVDLLADPAAYLAARASTG